MVFCRFLKFCLFVCCCIYQRAFRAHLTSINPLLLRGRCRCRRRRLSVESLPSAAPQRIPPLLCSVHPSHTPHPFRYPDRVPPPKLELCEAPTVQHGAPPVAVGIKELCLNGSKVCWSSPCSSALSLAAEMNSGVLGIGTNTAINIVRWLLFSWEMFLIACDMNDHKEQSRWLPGHIHQLRGPRNCLHAAVINSSSSNVVPKCSLGRYFVLIIIGN